MKIPVEFIKFIIASKDWRKVHLFFSLIILGVIKETSLLHALNFQVDRFTQCPVFNPFAHLPLTEAV